MTDTNWLFIWKTVFQSSFACFFFFFQAALQDSQVELETYKQSRQGLDEMYNVVWTQYKEEKNIRQVSDGQINHWTIL